MSDTPSTDEPRVTHWDGRGNAIFIYDDGTVKMQTAKVWGRKPIDAWVEENARNSDAAKCTFHREEVDSWTPSELADEIERLMRERDELQAMLERDGLQAEAAHAAMVAEQTVRADEALEELGALAYQPVFDDDDGEPRVTGWECRICGALEPKLSTFDHLDECPLNKPLPEAPK